ncbi:MAG: hypothetical protein DRO63_00570 [Candidatus Gerdarchaeota archaeon]|nr:MAG: hypothetical protein DRO63_00570 [Candidatus Gerdarchaeota archaeon]
MPLNHLLLNTKIKMHLSNGFFLFLNTVHLFIASTLTISPKDEGLVRFHFSWLVQFQWQRLLIAFILLLIQVIITYLVLWWRFRQAKLIQITEFGLVGENHFLIKNSLRLDPKDIYKMVIDLAREFKLKSIKRVYLSNTNIPNALTIDVVPLPFLRSSWIVLDANIIEILDKKEIKAIIAHELAHIKKLDSIVNIYRFGINYFVFVAYSLQLLQMIYIIIADAPEVWNIVLRIALLLLLILAMWFLTIINRWLMNFSRQQAELLADYTAGKFIGRNTIINALIILGQRIDVVVAFGAEFKWLGKREGKSNVTREFLQGIRDLPPQELSKEFSRQKALYIYVVQRLKNLRDALLLPLSDSKIDTFAQKACEELMKLREKELKRLLTNDNHLAEKLSQQITNWAVMGTNSDQFLNDEEIEQLVAAIKNNPDKELFEADFQVQQELLPVDHPTIRSRILFLFDTLK